MSGTSLNERIAGQLFLSTMLNITDGEFAAERGRGAGLIQLGTMLLAPETEEYAAWRRRWPKGFLPNDPAAMELLLRSEIAKVKEALGEVVFCLSLASEELASLVSAAQAFHRAGGHFVELNCHGGLQPWVERGYLMGMSFPQHRQRLLKWVEALSRLEIPLMVKFNANAGVDFAQICQEMAHLPILGLHFNVRHEATMAPNYAFVQAIRPKVKGLLLCSGYAWTPEAVRRLFAAGADAVGFAKPVADDPAFIQKMAQQLALAK